MEKAEEEEEKLEEQIKTLTFGFCWTSGGGRGSGGG